jgi:hypothetical protein
MAIVQEIAGDNLELGAHARSLYYALRIGYETAASFSGAPTRTTPK